MSNKMPGFNFEGRHHKKKNKWLLKLKKILRRAQNGNKQDMAIIAGGVLAVILIIALAAWGIVSIVSKDGDSSSISVDTIEIDPDADNKYNKDDVSIDKDKYAQTILPETEDAGQEYIDNTLFIGDSNTVRSLYYGFTTWENVVGAVGMGVEHITTEPVSKFVGMNDLVDVPTSVKLMQPQRIIVTYGTNNAAWNVDTFIKEYKKALKAIYDAYPYADIIVNAIPPVDKIRDYPNITMQQIDKFNAEIAKMCEEEGYKFLNSSEVLKDENTGFAKSEYTISDGIHLSKDGFTALFDYIRTHAYITEDRRPELSYRPKRDEDEIYVIGDDPIIIKGQVKVKFLSNNYELGMVDGEVEQTVNYGRVSESVTAMPKADSGAFFTGWSCDLGGISDTNSATITYTVPQISEEITEITVTANFSQVSLAMSKNNASLEKGESTNLSVSFSDARYTGDKTISWTSSNPSVATVDANGKVTAVADGTATIKASILGGKISATCSVTVSSIVKSITIKADNDATILELGKQLQLRVVANPEGAQTGNITWTSSDENIATVTTTGLVVSKSAGRVTITASINGGKIKAEYTIECKAASTPTPSPSPSPTPSVTPSPSPSGTPSPSPTPTPTPDPTPTPTPDPTPTPTPDPTPTPTPDQTPAPTTDPTQAPTEQPTSSPSSETGSEA